MTEQPANGSKDAGGASGLATDKKLLGTKSIATSIAEVTVRRSCKSSGRRSLASACFVVLTLLASRALCSAGLGCLFGLAICAPCLVDLDRWLDLSSLRWTLPFWQVRI